jgi:hypothetical protein
MLTLIAGFGLLVAIWWLTLRYGVDAAPTKPDRPVVMAAGLGALAGHGDEAAPEATRWVLCVGAALYFATTTVIGARGGASLRWVLARGLPATLVPVLLAVTGGRLKAWALPAIILAVALWHVVYRRRPGIS